MATNGQRFVEWKEQFVSKERGKRVVHYFLKHISGESVLAVVGTERSVRHMFYVVADDFLKVNELENSVKVNAAYRWRSRREVVNWLTSMLSKKQGQESPKGDQISKVNASYQNHLARKSKLHNRDIVWSGVAWTCGKQLKHFPAFCRNGITIAAQSFVLVMAEEEKHHLAYLEDMYEDRKGQKKVKVRWFHHNQEVQGVTTIRNPNSKEVFITPYAQVISVECIDGPAIILTSEHYEKCVSKLPEDLLARVHLCFRQFKNNRIKPFKLSKLRGYFDQPIFSCLDIDFLEDEEENVKSGAKRLRSCRGREVAPYELVGMDLKYEMLRKRLVPKYVDNRDLTAPHFKINEKIELLCQDSGIRGCWFRCTIMEVTRRKVKVKYDDLKDEDGSGNLEEWVSALRLAMPDKLGIRYSGRPTIRPAPMQNEEDVAFEVGSPVDAWWSDGWWEGVVAAIGDSEDEVVQVYVPSETLFLKQLRKDIRVSRDWVGDHWVDIEAHPNIVNESANQKEVKHDSLTFSSKETPLIDSKTNLPAPEAINGVLQDKSPMLIEEKDPLSVHEKEKDPYSVLEKEQDPYEKNPFSVHEKQKDPYSVLEKEHDPYEKNPHSVSEKEKDPFSVCEKEHDPYEKDPHFVREKENDPYKDPYSVDEDKEKDMDEGGDGEDEALMHKCKGNPMVIGV